MGVPPLDPNIRKAMGVSRGHWEGNVLVVEVTNFTNNLSNNWVIGAISATPGVPAESLTTGHGIPHSDLYRVTERYTPIDANTIHYEAQDRGIPRCSLSRGRSRIYAFARAPKDYVPVEYACFEGNDKNLLLMTNTDISGIRVHGAMSAEEAGRCADERKRTIASESRRDACSPRPIAAHHAFSSEFDQDKPVLLEGAVTKADWTNPHAWIYIDVKGADGKVVNWAIEMGPPNALLRRGWKKSSMQFGAIIKVEGSPPRTARSSRTRPNITMPDGTKIFAGTDEPPK